MNINPDPNGDPWIVGGAPSNDSCYDVGINFIPTEASLNKTLPDSVDNRDTEFLPPVYRQWLGENSCIQVSEIYYTLSYELNRKRGITNPAFENRYHPLYTYNLLNNGTGSYTYWAEGFKLVQENGCPDWSDYDDGSINDPTTRLKYWMTGSSKYEDGFHNTISSVYQFRYDTSITQLNYRKHWIADHGNGSLTGGLLTISVNSVPLITSFIPTGSPEHGKTIITQLGTTGSHALTIVGYNDSIWALDINQDGQYTNNVDINNDGYINVRDLEKGAYICANSWGALFGNEGFYFLPYSLLWTTEQEPAPGLTFCHAYTCDVFNDTIGTIPEPEITISTNIEHEKRIRLFFSVGHGNIESVIPEILTPFQVFNTQGGYYPMRGCYDGPIDLGLNFSHYFKDNQETPFQKIYFTVNEDDQFNSFFGQVNSIDLVDHRWNERFELPFPMTHPSPITNNSESIFSIDYYLLPHHEKLIDQDLAIETNRISRFTPTVTNNAILTVDTAILVDMYNSEIRIEAGSSLIMHQDSKITAKNGHCKVIIDGNYSTIGRNINFSAENGARLDIYLNNLSNINIVQNVNFNNCNIYAKNDELTFFNCTFNSCKEVDIYWGEITFSTCQFENTGLYLENTSRNEEYTATINGCTFTNNINELTGINLLRYGCYNITGNSISNYCNGIEINNSGNGKARNQIIENNTIHSCQMNGIIAYNSIGSMYRNNIYNNYYGIRFMNNCNFALHGDPQASTISETQQISNNINCEVYTSEFSFPYYFRFNSIVDPDNAGKPTDPLIWFDRPVYANTTKADVAYNHWGAGFVPSQDLMGNNVIFMTYPYWTPGTIPATSPDEDLYTSASNNFSDGNYTDAKSQYMLLIDLYPTSQYAEAAMKDLVRLEEYLEKDFSGLKEYFLTNDSINADTTLTKLADISANQCEIKQQNYPVAIEWYENRIENSGNTADSIYAVIDLGYLYLLMEEDGLKSNYIGQHPEFKPVNELLYSQKKKYLLSLLPEIQTDKTSPLSQNEQIIYNYPNPANETSTISYILDSQTDVVVRITDNTGKLVAEYKEGNKSKGLHNIIVNTSSFVSGLYFYSLFADGNLIQTQKMSVINK